MHYVYIIKGPRNTVYVGLTKKDLKRKIEEHRGGVGAIRIDTPFHLVYAFQTRSESEAQLKKSFIKALFKANCLTFKNTLGMVRYGLQQPLA